MNGNPVHPTTDKKALEKKREEITAQIWALEDAERRQENADIVGKCFRYRNCYSCPKTEADRWWLYQRVTAVDKRGWLTVFRFQRDCNGKVEIWTDKRLGRGSLGLPITLRQFQRAWKVTVATVNRDAAAAKAVRS